MAEKFPPLAKYWPHLQRVSAKQAAFLVLDQFEAFYGGAAGGGKSDALLAAALQYVDIPGYAALILRRTYAELEKSDGLIPRADAWLSGTDAHRIDGGKKWVFPSGARIEFGHVKDEVDKHGYQSAAYSAVLFDELTSFTESIYEYIAFSRSRRPMEGPLSRVPIRVRSASNPGNIGHLWVKQRFVTEKTRQPGVVFIPATVADNPGLDVAQYRETMSHLSESLQAQLLEGDWDAFHGAAFAVSDEHLVDGFALQDAHERFEAADYGLNGCPWALISVDYEGNLVFYDLLYVKDMLPSDVCDLVIEKRKGEWGVGNVAYLDPSIWHRTGARNKWGAPAMLADEFTDHGVPVVPANNDPRAGLIRLRELLELDPAHPFPSWHVRAGELGAPRVFFARDRCARLIEELRASPLQPVGKTDSGEKVDPEYESRYAHSVPMARYAVMTRMAPSIERAAVPDWNDEAARRAYLQAEALRVAEERWDREARGGEEFVSIEEGVA